MAKKHASELRREDHGPDDLRRFAVMLEKLAADARAIANRMSDEIGKHAIQVDGATKGRTGIKSIEAYFTNVEVAISKNKKSRFN